MEHTHSKTNVLWKQIVKNKCIYLLDAAKVQVGVWLI